jgi:hypothetical protein
MAPLFAQAREQYFFPFLFVSIVLPQDAHVIVIRFLRHAFEQYRLFMFSVVLKDLPHDTHNRVIQDFSRSLPLCSITHFWEQYMPLPDAESVLNELPQLMHTFVGWTLRSAIPLHFLEQ